MKRIHALVLPVMLAALAAAGCTQPKKVAPLSHINFLVVAPVINDS